MTEENHKPALCGRCSAATNVHNDNSRDGTSKINTAIEETSQDITAEDAALLRRQIIKLNRRLQLVEGENKEHAKREIVMYSITVAFWLFTSWLWFHR